MKQLIPIKKEKRLVQRVFFLILTPIVNNQKKNPSRVLSSVILDSEMKLRMPHILNVLLQYSTKNLQIQAKKEFNVFLFEANDWVFRLDACQLRD